MLMTYKKEQQIDLVKLMNNFSDNEVARVGREIDFILIRGQSRILIDVSELLNIGKGAVDMLLRLSQKATQRNGSMVLLNPSKQISSVLKLAKLECALKVFFCKQTAIQALN